MKFKRFSERKKFKGTKGVIPSERLERLLDFASDCLENVHRKETLFYLVKIYADKLNICRNDELITYPDESSKFWGSKEKFDVFEDFFVANGKEVSFEHPFTISLTKNAVISNVRKKKSLYETLDEIGKPENPWVVTTDHSYRLFLPFGVTEVYDGNHSANCGKIKGEGILTFPNKNNVSEIFDISSLYGRYYFNGVDFCSYADKKDKVRTSFEIGCIYELGRIINDNGIQFLNYVQPLQSRKG